MRVFVTGGTGAIGRYAVPALVSAGYAVTALARTDGRAAELAAQGAAPRLVSLFDRAGLAEAFAGHDAVLNLASALPATAAFVRKSAWRECHRVRSEGSAAVVGACLDASVPRLVQESVVMMYRDGGSGWIDEDHPLDRFPASVGNHAAETQAAHFADEGGAATVLRFGLFYGRGAAHSEEMLALARRHLGFVPGPGGNYTSSIHLADAAAAVVAAVTSPAGVYNIVDDRPVTKAEHARALGAAVGARPWIRGPGRAGLLLGDRLTSMTRSLRVANARFREVSGWGPRFPSVWEGYREMAGAAE